jgi:uncharacterized repeat protein (TIGR01451 family)
MAVGQNGLLLTTVIAVLVHLTGAGRFSLPTTAALQSGDDPAALGALPAWFTGASAPSDPGGPITILPSTVLPAWFTVATQAPATPGPVLPAWFVTECQSSVVSPQSSVVSSQSPFSILHSPPSILPPPSSPLHHTIHPNEVSVSGPGEINNCDVVPLTIVAANDAVTTTNVVITSSMPPGFAPPQHVCTYPTVLPNETIICTAVFTGGCGVVSGQNETTVSQDGRDDFVVLTNFVVNPGAITLRKEPAVIPAALGDVVTWIIYVENTGYGNVSNVAVTDTLDSGLQYVSGITSTAYVSIPAGATESFALSARVASCSDLTNDASPLAVSNISTGAVYTPGTGFALRNDLSPGESYDLASVTWSSLPGDVPGDRDYAPTSGTTNVHAGYPDLILAKSAAPPVVDAGGLLTYTLAVTNTGIVSATGVVISDTVPVDTTFMAASGGVSVSGPPVGSTGIVSWYMGTLDIGKPQQVTMTVQVDSGLVAGSVVTNTAWVTCTEGLTDTDVTTSPVGTTVDVTISKIDEPDPVIAGTILAYTLEVTNDGPSDARDERTVPLVPGLRLVKTVVPEQPTRGMPFSYTIRIINTGQVTFTVLGLTDTLLAADFYYVAGSSNPADPDVTAEPLLVWFDLVSAAGPLVPGASISVTFQVTTTADNGTHTNTAAVTGDHPGGTITDTDDAPIWVVDPAIRLDKHLVAFDDDEVQPNHVTFTIAIKNTGPSAIDVLPLQDPYDPYYLGFVDATPYPDAEDRAAGTLTWYDLTAPPPGGVSGFSRNLPPGEGFLVTTVFSVAHTIDVTTTNVATTTGAADVHGNDANNDTDGAVITESIPTAVELLYFRARPAGERMVQLEWATAVEHRTTSASTCTGHRRRASRWPFRWGSSHPRPTVAELPINTSTPFPQATYGGIGWWTWIPPATNTYTAH